MSEALDPGTLTRLLHAHREGDRAAFDELVSRVYPQLRGVAIGQLAQRRSDGTLDTTSLVNEAYLRLAGQAGVAWRDREHFFAIAARTMRHILVDAIRARTAAKRGGGEPLLELGEFDLRPGLDRDFVLAVDQALERLSEIDERLVQIVECRWFVGLSEEETARALGLSLRTTQRCWMRARAWLRKELED